MDSNFIGEIRAFPYNFAPDGWVACNGQPLAIAQFETLYAVIGTAYGGDSHNTYFNVPDLRGVATIGSGQNKISGTNYQLGEKVGSETVTLTNTNVPPHTHTFSGATGAGASRTSVPDNQSSYLSDVIYEPTGSSKLHGVFAYLAQPNNSVNLNSATLSPAWGDAGGVLPHENRVPYQVIQYCICYDGVFPAPQ